MVAYGRFDRTSISGLISRQVIGCTAPCVTKVYNSVAQTARRWRVDLSGLQIRVADLYLYV